MAGGFTCTSDITNVFGHQHLSTWFCSCCNPFIFCHIYNVTKIYPTIFSTAFLQFKLKSKHHWILFASHILQYFQNSIKGLGISAHWGEGKFCWEGNFYVVVGIWGAVILTIQTFFRVKKQHIVKIPSVGVNVKFCRNNFFIGWWKFEEEWF